MFLAERLEISITTRSESVIFIPSFRIPVNANVMPRHFAQRKKLLPNDCIVFSSDFRGFVEVSQ